MTTPPDNPVDGAALLDEAAQALGDYVIFPSEAARLAAALWVLHTHALAACESTPRLVFLSAEKQSGKTRAQEVIELLAHNPKHAASLSAAALFRLVAAGPLTLLMDEVDAIFGPQAGEHEDLRGLLNAGHRRGAEVYRCVGEGSRQKAVPFPAFAPVALAAIGSLPDTIIDRSIVITMRRRLPTEKVEPFRHREATKRLTPIREGLAAWAAAHLTELEEARPEMPPGITDRPADVWEPLLALAEVAGGEWPERARAAAVHLNAERQKADPSMGMRLLEHIRTVFAEKQTDRLPTAVLLGALNMEEEWPWGALPRTGKPLDPIGLARRLKPFGVRPGTVRFNPGDKDTLKGYELAWFKDAFDRYLPAPNPGPVPSPSGKPVTPVTPVTPREEPVTGTGICDGYTRHTGPEPSHPYQEKCDGVTGVTAFGEGQVGDAVIPGRREDQAHRNGTAAAAGVTLAIGTATPVLEGATEARPAPTSPPYVCNFCPEKRKKPAVAHARAASGTGPGFWVCEYHRRAVRADHVDVELGPEEGR